MKILVEVEVRKASDECKFCTFYNNKVEDVYWCILWQQPLKRTFDGYSRIHKCDKCLNATRVEK